MTRTRRREFVPHRYQLAESDIVVLLVSADLLAEADRNDLGAVLRGELTEGRLIVPVLVRPTDLEGLPLLRLQQLPRGDRAITRWPNRDEAWVDVVQNGASVKSSFASSFGLTRSIFSACRAGSRSGWPSQTCPGSSAASAAT